jgi:hypothetical protein
VKNKVLLVVVPQGEQPALNPEPTYGQSFTYRLQDRHGMCHTYSISSIELREAYQRFLTMTDEEFLQEVPNVLHYVSIVSWIREVELDELVSDLGLIHRLVHLLAGTNGPGDELLEIRYSFAALWPPDDEELRDVLPFKGLKVNELG